MSYLKRALIALTATGILAGTALGNTIHRVKKDEVLSTIAQDYPVSWREIARANGLEPPYTIKPKQKLTIPDVKDTQTNKGSVSENSANLRLVRHTFTENSTIGNLYVNGEQFCHTLELPYRNNENNISSIPLGTYKVIRWNTEKFGKHFKVLDVESRSDIVFHYGCFPSKTEGCILLGTGVGEDRLFNSRRAQRKLSSELKQYKNFTLTIENGERQKPKNDPDSYTEYTIRKGDTLSEIARSYRKKGYEADWRKLRDFNGVDPTALRIGQTIKIPK